MATGTSDTRLKAVSLFDVDAELRELIGPTPAYEARARSVLAVTDLPPGPLDVEALVRPAHNAFGLMITEGVVLRDVVIGTSIATELLGPTDVIDLAAADHTVLSVETALTVPEAARVAILDDRLLPILRAWPSVGRTLLMRAATREARLSTHRAIAQLPRVDQRLLAFFSHMAERWGRVTPAGLVVPLQLTHQALGRLIGARRPTVSLALKELASSGLLTRRDDGAWLMPADAFADLSGGVSPAAGWQLTDARRIVEAHPKSVVALPSRPAAPRPTPAKLAELSARVERLRREHAAQVARSASLLEHSRLRREERQARFPQRDAA